MRLLKATCPSRCSKS